MVVSALEPVGWNTRHLLIEINRRFNLFEWKLGWNRRTSNALAIAVVKTLVKNSAIAVVKTLIKLF